MKIPKAVKIGNLTYQVGILESSEQDQFWGRSSLSGQWVHLHPRLLPDKRGESFIHEITHQILEQAGWHEASEDEKMIKCLANGLYQVLKDNDLLAK